MSGPMALGTMLALPVAAAALIPLAARRPNLREGIGIAAGLALFALVARWVPAVMEGARPFLLLAEPIPGLAVALAAEPLGMLFALVASGLWPVTVLYAVGYMRAHHEGHQTRFFAFFALAIASAAGVALAANLFTLFLFYELLTLTTYPLVTHAGSPEARRAGRTYLGILLATSIGLQLPALVGVWVLAGTLDFRVGGVLAGTAPDWVLGLLLGLFVLGVGKAAVMPVHRWLPAAMVAPTPVSALLHAVAVVKAGVFTILKVTVYTFGLDTVTRLEAAEVLLGLASATVLLASFVALRQDDLKRRLAYSTVSQLSYIVAGALLAVPLGIQGGALHIATHAFGKITLFFCAGLVLVAAHRSRVTELNGLGRAMPWTFAAFFVASLSVIGLPPGGGLWSKWYLALASLEAGQAYVLGVLMLSSVLNVAYLLPVPVRAFFGTPAEEPHADRVPRTSLAAVTLTATGAVALFFYPEGPYALVGRLFPGGDNG